jgi:hypothetical protein
MQNDINLENLKTSSLDSKFQTLHSLKNELIGCKDIKKHYFNKGIIEVLLPLLGLEQDENLLCEIVTILNCFFFEVDNAILIL